MQVSPKNITQSFVKPKFQSPQSSLFRLTGLISLVLILLASTFLNVSFRSVSADEVGLGYAYQIGGTDWEDPTGVTVDADNSIYVTGEYIGTTDFDPGAGTSNLTAAGDYDVFVAKFDSAGNFVWAKSLGGTGYEYPYAIYADDTHLYTVAQFAGTADLDPGVGTSNVTSAGSSDIFISKLDFDGNFVWGKSMGGTGSDWPWAVTTDTSGNVYTTGAFAATADFDPGAGTSNLTSAGSNDIFISKLDSSGNFVWAKGIGGTGFDYGGDIALDSSNNVYTTGAFRNTADFDPGAGTSNLTSAGNDDGFISKLDSSGNFIYGKKIGGTGADYTFSFDLDADENLYISGQFTSTVDFDPGAGTVNFTSNSSADNFVLKLASDGTYLTAFQFGGDDLRSLQLDDDNNIYTAGSYRNTLDFDPGAGTYNITSAGGYDVVLTKFDSDGELLFAKKFGGTSSDNVYGMVLDIENNIYTTGSFSGTVDFDPGSGTSNLVSAGSYDIFISKLSPVSVPTLATASASLVTTSGATLTSNITATGGENPDERGFEYGTTGSYGSELSETGSFSTGSYSLELTGLACGTIYHFRSYATNSAGTSTGSGTSFTTSQCSSSGSGGGGGSSSDDGPLSENPTGFNSETCIGSSTTDSCVTQAEINSGAQIITSISSPASLTTFGSKIDAFLRNLGFGSIGEDVRRLQQFLNQNNFILASSGNGSPGKETTYYGPRTTRAITKFQEYYKEQILTPLGLENGTGYFGERTRGFVNNLLDK